MQERGYEIGNIDVTLVLQAPKVIYKMSKSAPPSIAGAKSFRISQINSSLFLYSLCLYITQIFHIIFAGERLQTPNEREHSGAAADQRW